MWLGYVSYKMIYYQIQHFFSHVGTAPPLPRKSVMLEHTHGGGWSINSEFNTLPLHRSLHFSEMSKSEKTVLTSIQHGSVTVPYYLSLLVGKPTMWFPNRSDTNRAVYAQKMARDWKFWI